MGHKSDPGPRGPKGLRKPITNHVICNIINWSIIYLFVSNQFIIFYIILVQTCKERWKNLRTVFFRNLRQKIPSGSSGGIKKKNYLEHAMQFLMTFIKSGKQQQGNLLIPLELENNSNIDEYSRRPT